MCLLGDGLESEEGREIVLNREPVPISCVVDLVNSAGAYLRPDGYAGDCGAELADDGRWDVPRECFAVSGTALVTTASALERVWASRAQLFRLLRGHRLVLACPPFGLSRSLQPGLHGSPRPWPDKRWRARCSHPVPRRTKPDPYLGVRAPIGLAVTQARRKWRGGGDDGVQKCFLGRSRRRCPSGPGCAAAGRSRAERL